MKKICVLGLGYMGLPTASLLATHGHTVVGVDINQRKIEAIKNRELPFDEPGLQELVFEALDSDNLTVQTDLIKADVFLIAVPTPVNDDKTANVDYVISAAEMIAPFLQKNNLVILESTVPASTAERVLQPILESTGLKAGKDFYLSHCPERAIPGNTLYELINNDRIIGGIDQKSAELTQQIYQSFVKGNIYLTSITTAEMVKLMENTTRDINIALANEFAKIAENIGVNIWEAIELANHHPRINVLQPGPGVGGHCIAVDPWFLTQHYDKGLIIKTARTINDGMGEHVIGMVKKAVDGIQKPAVSVLGVAYKANVDDARETPAEKIIHLGRELGWNVRAHDHLVQAKGIDFTELLELEEALAGSDCIILVTNHKEYLDLDPALAGRLMRTRQLVDTRNHLDHQNWRKQGFTVRVLGNGRDQ